MPKLVFTLCIALVVLFCYQWVQRLHLQCVLPATCTGGVFLVPTSTFTSAPNDLQTCCYHTLQVALVVFFFYQPDTEVFTFVIRKLYLVLTMHTSSEYRRCIVNELKCSTISGYVKRSYFDFIAKSCPGSVLKAIYLFQTFHVWASPQILLTGGFVEPPWAKLVICPWCGQLLRSD